MSSPKKTGRIVPLNSDDIVELLKSAGYKSVLPKKSTVAPSTLSMIIDDLSTDYRHDMCCNFRDLLLSKQPYRGELILLDEMVGKFEESELLKQKAELKLKLDADGDVEIEETIEVETEEEPEMKSIIDSDQILDRIDSVKDGVSEILDRLSELFGDDKEMNMLDILGKIAQATMTMERNLPKDIETAAADPTLSIQIPTEGSNVKDASPTTPSAIPQTALEYLRSMSG